MRGSQREESLQLMNNLLWPLRSVQSLALMTLATSAGLTTRRAWQVSRPQDMEPIAAFCASSLSLTYLLLTWFRWRTAFFCIVLDGLILVVSVATTVCIAKPVQETNCYLMPNRPGEGSGPYPPPPDGGPSTLDARHAPDWPGTDRETCYAAKADFVLILILAISSFFSTSLLIPMWRRSRVVGIQARHIQYEERRTLSVHNPAAWDNRPGAAERAVAKSGREPWRPPVYHRVKVKAKHSKKKGGDRFEYPPLAAYATKPQPRLRPQLQARI